MRNDPIFKFVALIVLAGVVIALVDPASHAPNAPAVAASVKPVTAPTEASQ